MDGGGHQETSRPQLVEGICESRTGTAMLVFNRLQSAVSFTIVIYDRTVINGYGCKRKAFRLLARTKHVILRDGRRAA